MRRGFVVVLVFAVSVFASGVPRLLNYQAKLTDASGVGLTGTHDIIFRIYTVPTGGAPIWTEPHTGADAITVTNGLFDVQLGTITPLTIAFDDTYWIELEVDGEVLSPRERLVAVPYAFRAVTADTAFVLGAGAVQTNSPLTGDGTSTNPLGLSYGSGLTLSGSALVVNAGSGLGFSGSQLVNTGVTSITAGAGISVSAGTGDVTITNTGDTDASDDLTTSTSFSGDVSGPYDNLQLGTGVVGNAEISNSAVFVDVQDGSGTSQFTVTDGDRALQFAGTGGASVSFDAANHRVTIDASGASDGNNYVNGISFDTGTGVLTLSRLGLSSLTEDLDGRYAIASELNDGSTSTAPVGWNDITGKPSTYPDDDNVVGNVDGSEITDGTITSSDISNSFVTVSVRNGSDAEQFTVTDGDNRLQFVGSGLASVSFDATNHRVTISATGDGQGITSINGQTGPSITISGGTGISVSAASNTVTVTNTGVTSVNGSTGDVTLADLTPGAGLSGSSYNGSSAVTFSVNVGDGLAISGDAVVVQAADNSIEVTSSGIKVALGQPKATSTNYKLYRNY